MKLFSSEISTVDGKETAKAVTINKSRNGYELLDYYNTEPENLKSLSGDKIIHYAINYFDTIIESIRVPEIKDPKTFKMLAENKLKDRLEEGTDYLMAYKVKDSDLSDSRGNIEHKVYILPSKLYTESDVFTESQKERTCIFTLADFSLCGVSAKAFPDDTVFHCFADESKIIINVSQGSTIIYTRVTEYNTPDDDTIDSLFYESINLTYMFVTKNLKVDVQRFILSGKMMNRPELSKMSFAFNSVPQSVLLPERFVKGCSREVFHEFLIPISLCMLDEAYDFTPIEYKEIQGFNSLKAIVNSILCLLVVALLYVNVEFWQELGFANERYRAESNVIKLKLDRNINNFNETGAEKYGLYYLNQIERYSLSAFDLYTDTADILESADYEKVTYQFGEDDLIKLNINGKLKFKSLKEIDGLKQFIEEKIKDLENKKSLKVKDKSRYNMDILVADVKIIIERVGR